MRTEVIEMNEWLSWILWCPWRKQEKKQGLGEEGETRREDGVKGRILMVDRWYPASL